MNFTTSPKQRAMPRSVWCVCGLFAFLAFVGNTSAKEVAGRSLDGWVADLDSTNRTVRLRAAKTIGIFGKDAVSTMAKMLGHDDAAVRYWAASHLGNASAGDQATKALQALVANDKSRGVRMAASYALCSTGDVKKSSSALLESLNSNDRGAACAAADFLGRLGARAKSTLPQLKVVNKETRDYHIRGATKNAIRLITDPDALENHTRPTGGGPSRDWNKGRVKKDPGSANQKRPNILWISVEDISSNLGCYGDEYASTPNLDRLASQGVRYTRAFTPAGVCAVVRSGIITGRYPISIGTQHMRTSINLPGGVKCFPEYLRKAGYFCTNKSKTDYQLRVKMDDVWDRQGGGHSDWRERKPGQPFFSVINLTISHESQIRHGEKTHAGLLAKLKPEQRHDPDKAGKHLPPIYPNTPEARKDWAWYSDNISEVDRQAGEILKRLEDDGLTDNTIVILWSDHGRGLPRGKRWIYDSGTHIPMIIRWPNKLKAGSVNGELTSTQDLPPTMLALAGVARPDYMHGRVLVGDEKQDAPDMLFFHRDRMDEAQELMRAARDDRFKYIRNYEPERTYAQHIDYMDKMPTLVDMRQMNADGKLNAVQARWFSKRKPTEELYDIVSDPHETVNLADKPEFAKQLQTMRRRTEQWQESIGDMGLIPEPVMLEELLGG